MISKQVEHEGNLLIGSYFGLPGNHCKYHERWDYLIPIIDDIYYSRRFSTGVQTSEISSQPCILYSKIREGLLHLSIEQTWQAVVQFIKWFNSQPPSQ